ncbi:U3 small nucleolar RNA-associated protein [Drechslerella dactyloides]|uniref:U3 small nucleolar RNA-associated protein n=1 Tax=Drechslerella dactyloides TaxID=74499 RepID=A0AAD6NP86_DREDA|nr:U3 small nucleolar RNA-associated protein [Drechslerella dactyloides]
MGGGRLTLVWRRRQTSSFNLKNCSPSSPPSPPSPSRSPQPPTITMSSLRNAVQRRPHRERSQLSSRTRLGHLEKHRDYTLRARDYASKKRTLSSLRAKVASRNPDEFYFAMTNAHTNASGIHVSSRPTSVAMPVNVVRGLKMQDKAYLRVMADMERRKRERLESEVTFVGDDGTVGIGRKTVFDDDGDAISTSSTSKQKHNKQLMMLEDDDEDEMDWEDDDEEEREEEPKQSKKEAKAAKARTAKYRELEARMKREAELRSLERQVDAQREYMGKSAPRTGMTRDGKRWFNNARKK